MSAQAAEAGGSPRGPPDTACATLLRRGGRERRGRYTRMVRGDANAQRLGPDAKANRRLERYGLTVDPCRPRTAAVDLELRHGPLLYPKLPADRTAVRRDRREHGDAE